MFNSSNLTGTMLVQTLVELFADGQIDLTELWDTIEQDMSCQQFDGVCVGYEPACVCSHQHN